VREPLFKKVFSELNDQERLLELIFYASLAPSTLNTQPWLFKIKGLSIEVVPNKSRQLAVSDKDGREMYISIGAAVQNLLLAAEAHGLSYTTEIKNEGGLTNILVSFTNLKETNNDKPTLEALLRRHTNRSPFDKTPLPTNVVESIRAMGSQKIKVNIISDAETKNQITAIAGKAISAAFSDKKFTKELSHWMKPSLQKYKDGMPGYYIGIPWLISFFLPWIIRHKNLREAQKVINENYIQNCSEVVVLTGSDDTPSAWIEAGQIFEKIAILAEKENIKVGVLTAPIEIGQFYKDLQQVIKTPERPHMFFRLGYSNVLPKFSPRIPINNLIIP
jgi:hypothetical protein